MSLEALYSDRIEAALQRDLAAPPRPKEQSFSTWSFLSAGAKGAPRAGLEVVGSAFDAVGEGVRNVQDAFLMDRADPSQTLSGVATRMDDRAALTRGAAHGFAPPETAHQADQVLHNLVRVGTKAAAAMAVGGPVAGGIALAAEEGNTTYRELIQRGIDPATAMQVAGVTGVATGVSVALPLAGQTVKGTVGLIGAGGPGAYMAQEKLSQQILAKAGYHDEASMHNPLDPLGLALSTLLPAAFGGAHLAMRPKAPSLSSVVEHLESKGKRYGNDGELLTSPKGAQGEMQVMPATSRDPGFGVTPARDGSPEELARVGRDYIAAMEQRYPGEPAKALAAYNAGPGAVDAAVKKYGADWGDHIPQETKGYVAHGMNKLRDDAKAHVAMDPEVVDAARTRVTNDALQRSLPEHMDARAEVMRASDEVAAGRMPEVREMPTTTLPEFKAWFADSKVVDEAGEPLVVYKGMHPHDWTKEVQEGRGIDTRVVDPGPLVDSINRQSNFPAFNGPGDDGVKVAGFFSNKPEVADRFSRLSTNGAVFPVHLAMSKPFVIEANGRAAGELQFGSGGHQFREAIKSGDYDGVILRNTSDEGDVYVALDPKQIKSAIGNSGKFDPNSASLTDPLKPGERNPRSEGTNVLPPPDRVTIEAPTAPAKGEGVQSPEAQRVAKMAEESPDLMVVLPGHEKPMKLSDALESAKATAAEEAKEATLVQAALDCALGFGA